MSIKPLALAFLALSSLSAYAASAYGSAGRLTLNLRLTTVSEPKQVGDVVSHRLLTTRFGNRELLQYLADRELIPSIKGYTLMDHFRNNGGFDFFGAYNASTGHRVAIPFDILEEFDTFGLNATTYNQRTESYKGTSKWHSTAVLCDASLSLFRAVNYASATGKVNGEPYPFIATSYTGTLQGANDDLDFLVEGTISVSRSTIFQYEVG
jgi:hypothetical protein